MKSLNPFCVSGNVCERYAYTFCYLDNSMNVADSVIKFAFISV
jgi:hypothetical protein